METKKVTTKTTATKAAAAVYNALAAADKALSVEEIAKAAQISANEVLVGLGWLFKEGKVAGQEDNKVVLA